MSVASDLGSSQQKMQGFLLKFYAIKEVLQRIIMPPTFQKIIIIIGIVITIISIILISMAYHTLNKRRNHPPDVATCPDYYTLKSIDGEKVTCTLDKSNVRGTNTGEFGEDYSNDVTNFSYDKGELIINPRTLKKKALLNNIVWDGITNDENL